MQTSNYSCDHQAVQIFSHQGNVRSNDRDQDQTKHRLPSSLSLPFTLPSQIRQHIPLEVGFDGALGRIGEFEDVTLGLFSDVLTHELLGPVDLVLEFPQSLSIPGHLGLEVLLDLLGDLVSDVALPGGGAGVQSAPAGQEVVHADVCAADAALAGEGQTAVQHAPVVEDEGRAGLQLDLDLQVLHLEDLAPLARRVVPPPHLLEAGPARRRRPVVVVPPHLAQPSGLVVHRAVAAASAGSGPAPGRVRCLVPQDRKAGLDGAVVDTAHLLVPTVMAHDRDGTQHLVRAPVYVVQVLGGLEAVDERRLAATALGV